LLSLCLFYYDTARLTDFVKPDRRIGAQFFAVHFSMRGAISALEHTMEDTRECLLAPMRSGMLIAGQMH